MLGDDLALCYNEVSNFLELFIIIAHRYFPGSIYTQVEWPLAEQRALAKTLLCSHPLQLDGDSWYLPLVFGLACKEWGRPWPAHILVSGSIRQCRGLRCVSIGGAIFKLRYAQNLGFLCFLPKSNVTQMRRRDIDISSCVALPFNVDACLNVWKEYVG